MAAPTDAPAQALDPRNDGWVRGVQEGISVADDYIGQAVCAAMAALVGLLAYGAWQVGRPSLALGLGACAAVFVAAAFLLRGDVEDVERLQRTGRRVFGAVVLAETIPAGLLMSTPVRHRLVCEFPSPLTGRTLRVEQSWPVGTGGYRFLAKGDRVCLAYLSDDEHRLM